MAHNLWVPLKTRKKNQLTASPHKRGKSIRRKCSAVVSLETRCEQSNYFTVFQRNFPQPVTEMSVICTEKGKAKTRIATVTISLHENNYTFELMYTADRSQQSIFACFHFPSLTPLLLLLLFLTIYFQLDVFQNFFQANESKTKPKSRIKTSGKSVWKCLLETD